MATKTKTKTASTTKRPKTSAKAATRKLLAPKVKSKIGLKRLREAVKAVQEAAAAA